MNPNPLQMPQNPRLLAGFTTRFGLRADRPPEQRLVDVARAFSRLPYENLSKIVKEADQKDPRRARRLPDEVIGDHRLLGTGGTCFSLTAALLHLVRSLGFESQPILADRRYGQNTHCALLVWIDRQPHLLDPGYLIVEPVRLEWQTPREITTSFNKLILEPRPGGKIDLYTLAQGTRTFRLTFKTQPADPGEFLRCWDRSFDWEMMRYPVLTRITGKGQIYLQGRRFQVLSHQRVHRKEISPDDLIRHVSAEFGIDPSLVSRALEVLHRRGDGHG